MCATKKTTKNNPITGLKQPEEINPYTKITPPPPPQRSSPPLSRVPTIVSVLFVFLFFTRVRAQVPLQGGVAGEGALAVAADVAVHAGVDLHVLLQGLLGLEALCTQQTEHRHVSPWRTAQKTQTRLFQYRTQTGS